MEEILMEAVSLWNLPKGVHVAQEVVVVVVHVNILEEAPHLVLVVASIAELMATGLETAKLGTGRTSAIAVEKEVI